MADAPEICENAIGLLDTWKADGGFTPVRKSPFQAFSEKVCENKNIK